MQDLLNSLRNLQLSEWGAWSYLILAVLTAIEGPVATLAGAAAAAAGLMRPGLVFVAASVGNLTADTLWYTLGYLGKVEWIDRLGHRLGVDPKHAQRLQDHMRRNTPQVLFLAKLSMSLMIPSLVAAGLIKARWRHWFPALFAGEVIWTGTLVVIGYYATSAIKQVEQGLEYVALGGSVFFVVFLVWLSRRILRKAEESEPDSLTDTQP